jgi:hypothetical protein
MRLLLVFFLAICKLIFNEQGHPLTNWTNCSQLGPTLKGSGAGVIYSWLFKYTQQYTTSLHWVSVRPNAGFVSRDGDTFQPGTVATVVYGQDFRNIAQQPLIKMGPCICQPGTHWPSLLVEPWGHGIRYQYPVHVFVSNSTSKFKIL